MLNITESGKDRELVVSLAGRMDSNTAPQLYERIKESEGKIDSLIIDFSDLEYISSAGLRVLLSSVKMMKDGEMKIRNVSDEIMDIFDMTGFTDILTIE